MTFTLMIAWIAIALALSVFEVSRLTGGFRQNVKTPAAGT
jgi:hypothetical protein